MQETEGSRRSDPVLRAARLLGKILGFVPALLAAASAPRPNPVPPASESQIRGVAADLGLPASLRLGELKLAIADAIHAAPDEALARATTRLLGARMPTHRVDMTTAILRKLGAP